MKQLFILFLLAQALAGKAADTLHLITHSRQTVVTDPAKGFNLYKAWGRFPSSGESYGK